MKYLLIAHYAGFALDDPEDLVNSSWAVGTVDNAQEVIALAEKEIENYVDEQVDCQFDTPVAEMTEEELKEVQEFKNRFEILSSRFDPSCTHSLQMVKRLYLNAEYYFEDLKIEAVALE